MLKKLFLSLVVLLSVFSLAACGGKEKEAKGYGIVHKDYVGVADMKVKKGEVTAVTFEEYYLPYSWASLDIAGEEKPEDVLADVTLGRGTGDFAKYIKIGDKLFTGTVRDAALEIEGVTYANQAVKYSAEGIEDLFVWLKNSEANCKWYVEQILAEKAFIAKADGTKADYTVKGNAANGFTKSTTGYWVVENGLGWSGNMAKIAEALVGTKVNASALDLVQGEDKIWTIKGTASGATVTDFKDYYEVARRAYNTATK